MQKALIVTNERLTHQASWGGAFGRGLVRHGWQVSTADHLGNTRPDLLVMWGTRRTADIARQKLLGGEVCILERGYVADRFEWTSVSFGGGLNGRGVFRGPFDDRARWCQHFDGLLKPWKSSPDGYPLLMEQVPGDMSLRGVNIDNFYTDARHAFKHVKTRKHPNLKPSAGNAFTAAQQSLQADLADAAFVITWNSNSAVDAVLAGVPAIAMDQGSMAWDVTGHSLSVPPLPDRTAWTAALAWKQWSRDELESGYCWDHVHG